MMVEDQPPQILSQLQSSVLRLLTLSVSNVVDRKQMEANGDDDEEQRQNKVKNKIKRFRAFEARLEWKPLYLNSIVEPVR